MLDILEKALELVETLGAATPFQVYLTPDVVASLRKREPAIIVGPKQIVSKVSYAGDEGGIMCHLTSENGGHGLVVSMTHLRVRPNQLYTKAVLDYQKHRTKKLKKQ